ncbi:hypothetical protein CROQUDRAFT_673901 [Cronartium quercuum f. sp. fusiforme G11]|uniref:Uncharacterized protein n=1 Tax=Cronartium quercuum f. sp. fusiforme G11 TaxID=708437 RepID=A0A9P6N8Z8_9BASI|nr:hypothetical protein CROQUDRAFT_673901 [Cronartium quercuum f. sp. fusiforme G11]
MIALKNFFILVATFMLSVMCIDLNSSFPTSPRCDAKTTHPYTFTRDRCLQSLALLQFDTKVSQQTTVESSCGDCKLNVTSSNNGKLTLNFTLAHQAINEIFQNCSGGPGAILLDHNSVNGIGTNNTVALTVSKTYVTSCKTTYGSSDPHD